MIQTFSNDVTACIPRLTAFARRLAGNRAQADDLVQETVLRALVHADQFQMGTNLVGWLSTILRNCYFNDRRSARRVTSIEALPNLPAPSINSPQESHMRVVEVSGRLAELPEAQREALMLVGVEGYSYEIAAEKAGCAVGTMKSRVSRARTELQRDMGTRKVAANQRDLDHLENAA